MGQITERSRKLMFRILFASIFICHVASVAFAETAEVTPSCASLLSSSSEKGLPLTPEEITQHINALADFYLDLFHGPNASQKNNFLSEEMIMQKKLAEYEAMIPDISTRLSRVVEERLPQFEEAMAAKEHERAERLRESEEQLREIQKLDICSRTPQVRDAIMRLLGGKSCDQITLEDLKKITELNLTSSAHDEISELNTYDFYGLSSLETLDLSENQLSVLPEKVFAGLSSLETLDLSYNQLSVLPEKVFARLSSLETLDLSENQLSVLPEKVFAGLSSLETLDLGGNQLSVLPAGVFADLNSLKTLNLGRNQLLVLPEGVFAGLSSLETLNLTGNANFNFEIALLKNLKTMKRLYLPKHLENSPVIAELRKLLPGTKIDFY